MDLRAIFFLLYIIFVVLSPIEKCNSEEVILRGAFLISGRFSESSESMRCGEAMGATSCLYCISNSSSELPCPSPPFLSSEGVVTNYLLV